LHRLRSLKNLIRRPTGVAPAFAPFPLLHSVGGGGAWDEILGIGVIVLFLVALAGFGYFSGRQKKKRRGRDRRRSSRRS
jgi:4-hydroxybenzoate polyprenyltransferase